MRDLSGQVTGLSPSSMSVGNTVADDPALAMTAPGSRSVLPVADVMDVLPQPPVPARRDRTVLIGEAGEPAGTPAQSDDAWRQAPGYDGQPGPWRLT